MSNFKVTGDLIIGGGVNLKIKVSTRSVLDVQLLTSTSAGYTITPELQEGEFILSATCSARNTSNQYSNNALPSGEISSISPTQVDVYYRRQSNDGNATCVTSIIIGKLELVKT